MKRISIENYQSNKGELIDLSNPSDFLIEHDYRAINIPYQKLMLHHEQYLDKNKPYYLICSKGIHSAKATSILEYLGYDVTQVVKTK